jgi:hypothetical protein
MSLKALVNGKVIRSDKLSNEEWKALRTAQRERTAEILMRCGARAVLRAGSRKKHFAHYRKPEHCNCKPESPEHNEVKTIIAFACEEAGWEAEPEAVGPGYEADVLATKDGIRVVFEVQLTYQTLEKILNRRGKFEADDVKDYWVFRKLPVTKGSGRKTKRTYLLKKEGDEFYVQYPKTTKLLGSFVKRVLSDAERKPEEEEYEFEGNDEFYDLADIPDPFEGCLKVIVGVGITAIIVALLDAIFRPKK